MKAAPLVPPSHSVDLFPLSGQLLPALIVGPPFWGKGVTVVIVIYVNQRVKHSQLIYQYTMLKDVYV